MTTKNDTQAIEQQIQRWLDEVVIGLNLCPFAGKPRRNKQLKIHVCDANSEEMLLQELQSELAYIDEQPTQELETTLLVIPHILAKFADYNQFLNLADALLKEFSWQGDYQIASFHPHYCFAGRDPDAAENLTNRSPYPILHILREASLEAALTHYKEPEKIPAANIIRMESLSKAEKKELFPYLFNVEKL